MKYDRTKKLFGNDVFEKFKDVKLILLGVGGVGGYNSEADEEFGIKETQKKIATPSRFRSSIDLLLLYIKLISFDVPNKRISGNGEPLKINCFQSIHESEKNLLLLCINCKPLSTLLVR